MLYLDDNKTFIMGLLIGIFFLLTEPKWFSKTCMLMTIVLYCYSLSLEGVVQLIVGIDRPIVSSTFGGPFGLDCKNELWKSYLLTWIPSVTFIFMLAKNCGKYKKSTLQHYVYLTTTCVYILLDKRAKIFNYKAIFRFFGGKYTIAQKFMVAKSESGNEKVEKI